MRYYSLPSTAATEIRRQTDPTLSWFTLISTLALLRTTLLAQIVLCA